MERDTDSLVTTLQKAKVVYKSWLTGRERKAIEAVTQAAMVVRVQGDKVLPDDKGFAGTIFNDVQDEMVRQMVVSVNDVTDGAFDLVCDLRDDDYLEVIAALNEVLEKKAEPAKKPTTGTGV